MNDCDQTKHSPEGECLSGITAEIKGENMSSRITKFELDVAFEAYVEAVKRHGIALAGKPTLFEGSKSNGRAYRLFLVDSKGGQNPFPGIMGNGYLGMTRREAYDALWLAANVANDLHYRTTEER